ncbi:MAG: AgmX/PglI C-terminal domain-containing protein [bacterium]
MVFALLEVLDPPKAPETTAPRAPSSKAPATRPPAAAPRTQAPRPTPEGDLPRQLGRQDMLDVIQANAGRLKSCADADPNAKGTFTVAVTISRSGAVQQAKVVTARLRDSAATACIESQIKSYQFKPFAGDPMRLQIPFKI